MRPCVWTIPNYSFYILSQVKETVKSICNNTPPYLTYFLLYNRTNRLTTILLIVQIYTRRLLKIVSLQ